MKGVIFNLLENFVAAESGADAWEALLDEAGSQGVYTSIGTYPDGEAVKLLSAYAGRTGRDLPRLLRDFGQAALPQLRAKYPELFAGHTRTTSFLSTLESVIHREVRKLYPGAEVPQFEFVDVKAQSIVVVYRSAKRLCALAEGMMQAAGPLFGERATVTQVTCTHRGDAECRFECHFEPRGS